MGLRLRLTLSLLLPLVVIVGIHGLIRVRGEHATLWSAHHAALGRTADVMVAALEDAFATARTDPAPLIARLARSQQQIAHVRLFDVEGRVLAASSSARVPVAVVLPHVLEVLRHGTEVSFDEGTGRSALLVHLAPVRGRGGAPAGVLEVAEEATGIEAQVDAAIRDVWVRLGLVTLAVAAASAVVLQREIFDPLSELTHGIVSLGRGHAAARVRVERGDELGRVAEAFNTMAAQLEAARRHLESETRHALDLQQHLQHAERLAIVGKLASGLAHEIGTPLNIISGRAEMLLESLATADPRRAELAAIVDQIDRIAAFIRALLDTARRDARVVEPVALADVVNRLGPLVEHAARRRDIAVTVSVAPELPPILGDPNQLQQVLMNLLMNAFEATPPGGRATLSAAPEARGGRAGVALTVRDTGTGIRAEDRARIFEPFFSTKPAGQGTGLGLPIARDIVRAHGGDIVVGSNGAGGTAVTVWLPTAGEVQRAA